MVKIWVSPVFDLIPRQNISEEKSLLLESSLQRKNLQAFCCVIPLYPSSSLLQMCCCVFWPHTLRASFDGAGQLLLVLPPWPMMPSLLLLLARDRVMCPGSAPLLWWWRRADFPRAQNITTPHLWITPLLWPRGAQKWSPTWISGWTELKS